MVSKQPCNFIYSLKYYTDRKTIMNIAVLLDWIYVDWV